MGIRLTGLSTPVIGAEWEYIDKKNIVCRKSDDFSMDKIS